MLFSMPQKLDSFISTFDTILLTTMISSSKTLNSSLQLFLTFLVFLFLMIFHGKIITSLSKQAFKRLGVLRLLQNYFTPPQILALYRGVVRLCMEYASHILGGSTHKALLEKVESRAFHLINSPAPTNSLQSLFARRIVASLSLYYRYYNGH